VYSQVNVAEIETNAFKEYVQDAKPVRSRQMNIATIS